MSRGPLPHIHHLRTYEPGKPIEDVARELGLGPVDDILKLASNENLLGPSPKALEAMCEAAGGMHIYPDGGTWVLREALAKHLDVEPGQILPGNGSNELIEMLGLVYLGPGRNLVMASQAFVVYRLMAAARCAEVIDVPMKQFTHDLSSMARALTPETQMIFIANPNNPTGTLVSEAELDTLIQSIPNDVLVVLDEAYIELLAPEKQPDTLKWVRNGRENVVVLRTFSKAYGLAGLRLGYAMACPRVIHLLQRVRQPFNVNAMAQRAALAALADEVHMEASRTLVREGLDQFGRELSRMGLEYVPSCANFILVRVGPGREVFQAMQRQSVIVRPMDGYGLPDYVRITLGRKEQNERALRVMHNLKEEGLIS